MSAKSGGFIDDHGLLDEAWQRVRSRGGAAGVDGIDLFFGTDFVEKRHQCKCLFFKGLSFWQIRSCTHR